LAHQPEAGRLVQRLDQRTGAGVLRGGLAAGAAVDRRRAEEGQPRLERHELLAIRQHAEVERGAANLLQCGAVLLEAQVGGQPDIETGDGVDALPDIGRLAIVGQLGLLEGAGEHCRGERLLVRLLDRYESGVAGAWPVFGVALDEERHTAEPHYADEVALEDVTARVAPATGVL